MQADLFETIKNRRSIREFKPDSLSEEVIEKLIDALIWAPSAGNLQSRKFYFVFNPEIKQEIARAAFNQDFISQAPLVVVGCIDKQIFRRYGERGINLYAICDVSASIENMLLAAQALNLGACWVGSFDEAEVSKILDLPGSLRPIVIVPVGEPAEKPFAPARKNKTELIEKIK